MGFLNTVFLAVTVYPSKKFFFIFFTLGLCYVGSWHDVSYHVSVCLCVMVCCLITCCLVKLRVKSYCAELSRIMLCTLVLWWCGTQWAWSRCRKNLVKLSTGVKQCLLGTFVYMTITSIKGNMSKEPIKLTALKCKPHVGEKREPRLPRARLTRTWQNANAHQDILISLYNSLIISVLSCLTYFT